MFFSFAGTDLRPWYEAPLNTQQTDTVTIRQRATPNSPIHACSLFRKCHPLQNYVQLLSSAAEAYRANFQRPVRQQMIEMISGGVRRRLGLLTTGKEASSGVEMEEMGKKAQAEPEATQHHKSHSDLESHPHRIPGFRIPQEQKVSPLDHFAKQPIDIDRGDNNFYNRAKICQPLTNLMHTVQAPLPKAEQDSKTIADKNSTPQTRKKYRIKDIDPIHKKRRKPHDHPLNSHKRSEKGPEKTARRKFVIKKAVHRFTPEEDEKLKLLVKQFGESSWSSIAKEMPGLNRKQIRDRYVNYLKKERIITEFTPEEDATILRLVKERGKRWSWIADELVGRTPIMLKNRFYATLFSALNTNPGGISLANLHKKFPAKKPNKKRREIGKREKKKESFKIH
eukprot:TRINITY_DN7536_c0_g1_i10.p1 TRINITY_DN7536_c0_g1~~TRINITY_DN7536_c0_g1_i10.p1  ORF type:complete len:395 (-),score=21.70 TRINITY_DN7536_c0_g1_i10:101-1285(-)